MVKFYSRELRGPLNAYRCIVPIITSYEIISNATPRHAAVPCFFRRMTMNDSHDERSNFNNLLDPFALNFEWDRGWGKSVGGSDRINLDGTWSVAEKHRCGMIEEYKRREEKRRREEALPRFQ